MHSEWPIKSVTIQSFHEKIFGWWCCHWWLWWSSSHP
jgi:hypothetical protein